MNNHPFTELAFRGLDVLRSWHQAFLALQLRQSGQTAAAGVRTAQKLGMYQLEHQSLCDVPIL